MNLKRNMSREQTPGCTSPTCPVRLKSGSSFPAESKLVSNGGTAASPEVSGEAPTDHEGE